MRRLMRHGIGFQGPGMCALAAAFPHHSNSTTRLTNNYARVYVNPVGYSRTTQGILTENGLSVRIPHRVEFSPKRFIFLLSVMSE